MENGNFAYLPKYKRRRVSAVRDYPPGCGRFAPLVVPKPPDEDDCVEKVDNSLGSGINAHAVNDGNVALTEIMHESLLPGKEGGVSPRVLNEQKNLMEFGADWPAASDQECGSFSLESEPRLASLEVCVTEKVVRPIGALELEHTGALTKVSDASQIIGVVQRKYPPPRKIPAVRDFPPSCGRNPALVVKEEYREVMGTEVIANSKIGVFQQGKSCIEECTVKELVEKDGKQMGLDVQDGDSQRCRVKRKLCTLSEDNVQAESESIANEDTDNTDELESFYQKQIELAQANVEKEADIDNLKSSNHKNQLPDHGCGVLRTKNDRRPCKPGSSVSRLQRRRFAIKTKQTAEHFKGTEKSVKKNPSLIKKPFQSENLAIQRNKVNVDHVEDFGNNCSDGKAGGDTVSDARRRVKEALDLYRNVYNELLKESNCRRTDLEAAKILKERGQYVNVGKQITGTVPGVEVGDKFHYWVELNIVGLHRQSQGGIDYVKDGQFIRATSIVASGSYDDDTVDSDVLIYTGAGGNIIGKKEPEDQKLERGNLALKNSIDSKKPVRVIRGFSSADARKTYFYDGLYTVESYWQEKGPHGKLIYKFKLVRDPDQPVLKKLKKL